MTEAAIQRMVPGAGGNLAVYLEGDPGAPAVLMTHSILSSSRMWRQQSTLLARQGFRVVRVDARGHGASQAPPPPYTMDDLAADSVHVLDRLGIDRAHYVGLSLGGMSGFGLGIHHGERWLSLCLCDARADAPASVAAPWDERIDVAQRERSCASLAGPTIERWFGKRFIDANPVIAERFLQTAAATRVDGFAGCARAIQGLNYLAEVGRIALPTTFIVGANDGVLPQAMRDLQALVPRAVLEVIPDAGHLPNIDQPDLFNAALLRHFERIAPQPSQPLLEPNP